MISFFIGIVGGLALATFAATLLVLLLDLKGREIKNAITGLRQKAQKADIIYPTTDIEEQVQEMMQKRTVEL